MSEIGSEEKLGLPFEMTMLSTRDFWDRLDDRMGREVDAASVGWIRLVIGAALLWQVGSAFLAEIYAQLGWPVESREIYDRYIDPAFFFKYPFFPFLIRMSGYVPYGVFSLILALSLALFVGWQTRWTSKLLSALWIFVFLQDASMYTDHQYLMVLYILLLAWIPVNRWFSSDRLTGRETRSTVPAWNLWLLRFQLSLMLISSGLNKFTSDWLAGAPIGEWMTVEGGNWGSLDWLRQHPTFYLAIGWGSAIFETIAGLALWSRLGAIVFVPLLIIYYLVDQLSLDVGISPLIGLLSIVFLNPSFPRRVFDFLLPILFKIPGIRPLWNLSGKVGAGIDRAVAWFDDTPVVGKKTVAPVVESGDRQSGKNLWLVSEWTKYALIVWVLIQIVLPLRWIGYSQAKDWAEYTSRFAWRGQTRDKVGRVTLTITLEKQQLRWTIDPQGEFPIPLAVLYTQVDLQKRGLSEGFLRDIVGTNEELVEQRINGLGFTDVELERLILANERFLDLQLSTGHLEIMASEPEFVRQYAREVAGVVAEITGDQVIAHALIEESVNSRPFATCVPATVEISSLASASDLWPFVEPLKDPLPTYEVRMAGARQVLAQRLLEKEMEQRTMGLLRPPEPLKSPAISDEADAQLNAEFADLAGS